MTGDRVKAIRPHREGLRMAEELGLWPEVSTRLAWLGWMALQQCDYPQARDLSGHLSGDYEASARLLGASESVRRAASMPSAPSEQAETDRIAAAAARH